MSITLSKYWPLSQDEIPERTKVVMSPISKCKLCNEYLAPSVGGTANHMKLYHGVTQHKRTFVPMDPEQRLETVNKGENKFKQFIIETDKVLNNININPVVVPTNKSCVDCSETQNDGVIRYDGLFLCYPCLTKRASL